MAFYISINYLIGPHYFIHMYILTIIYWWGTLSYYGSKKYLASWSSTSPMAREPMPEPNM